MAADPSDTCGRQLLRIEIGIVDADAKAGDAAAGQELAQELTELGVVEAGLAGRVDGGHDALVEDVEIEVEPGVIERAPGEVLQRACGGSGDPA